MNYKYKIKGRSVDQNLKTKVMVLSDYLKTCDRKYKKSTNSKFVRKSYRRYFNLKNDKNKDIIVVLYTMEVFVRFSTNLVNRNQNNIDILP